MKGHNIRESPCKNCRKFCAGHKGCLVWSSWFKEAWREVVKLFDHIEWVKKNDE